MGDASHPVWMSKGTLDRQAHGLGQVDGQEPKAFDRGDVYFFLRLFSAARS